MQLNVEQKKLILAKPAGHNLIRGVAGSGKTTVAVHRIPFLLNNYCFGKDDRILMVTFNKTLVNYIEYVYNKVEEEEADTYRTLFASDSSKVDIVTIDSLLYKYFNEFKKANKLKYELLTSGNKEDYRILSECIAEISKKNPGVSIIDHKNIKFLLTEIDWIKSCNYMELEEYQNADRIGRMSNVNADGPQRLIKNSETRKAIYELMQMYNKKLRENNYIDFKDMALIALRQAKKKVDTKYTHILIDESQDLTRVQLELLRLMYNEKGYSSITFIADTAQSIYNHSWLVKGRSFTSIGFDMTGKGNSLSKNYRTTTQITQAAYSLIENDKNIVEDENFVKPSLIDRQGSYPVYRSFKSLYVEGDFVVNEIKTKLMSDYKLSDIVVIAKNKNQLTYIKEKLDSANIKNALITKSDFKFDENDIKLITMHSIKGLEFKVVFIIGLNDDVIPFKSYGVVEGDELLESMERKLLYVGMTRANELLYMTSSSKTSKFIGEISPKYLKMSNKNDFSRFYCISIEDYLFREKIDDLFSNEEKVRQWILRELIDNYKYPKNLLEIEYKVNSFSKVGFVDAAVSIFNGNSKVPYIFIETKAYSGGLQNGFEQLKSYMASSRCQYGILTDGNEMIIINKDFEEINDIPRFHADMLPSSIENFSYVDIKHNTKYDFTKDGDSIDISVQLDGCCAEYEENSLRRLNIFSSIAAGIPIQMNDMVDGEFYLPNEWFSPMDDCFILKVRGDSMEGAGIDNGDHVVIRRQQTADNMNIVAVAIDDNATLKKFMMMGDTILLIAENPKYEPIQMKKGDVKVLGVAVGIIKKIH